MEKDALKVSDRFTDELPSHAALRVLLHSSKLILKKKTFREKDLRQIPELEKFKDINRFFIVRLMKILLSNDRLKFRLISVIVPVLLKEIEKEKS